MDSGWDLDWDSVEVEGDRAVAAAVAAVVGDTSGINADADDADTATLLEATDKAPVGTTDDGGDCVDSEDGDADRAEDRAEAGAPSGVASATRSAAKMLTRHGSITTSRLIYVAVKTVE